MAGIDPWYKDNLLCPVDHSPLHIAGHNLVSESGRTYPVIEGVPVMLSEKVDQNTVMGSSSLRRARGDDSVIDERASHLYLESVGISEDEKARVLELENSKKSKIDPVISCLVAATNGQMYKSLTGKLDRYPIPDLRLSDGNGKLLLDIGCSWGRWSIAAARRGYDVVGIDPSLGAIMAARRLAREEQLPIRYVVADARFLPFRDMSFDKVFSYSVFQHLSKTHVRSSLADVKRILKKGGTSLIQMPNSLSIRGFQNQLRRGFREAKGFEVRYWKIAELKKTFEELIGETSLSVDCFFGLGLQISDLKFVEDKFKPLILVSDLLQRMSKSIEALKYVSDSLYVKSVKPGQPYS